MKRFVILAGGIASAALAASLALAAQSPQDFLKTAVQGDNTEIAMGQLAQQKGSTQQLRSYGQTLIDDHTLAKQEKMDIGKQLSVAPSDAVKPEAGAMRTKLSGLSGMDFDRAFVAAMIDDHLKDIADYQVEASANNGPASALAGKQLPTLQKHLKMAQDIQKSESGAAAGKQATASEGFLSQESEGVWRGSKFVGVNIYGPDDRKVGDINDVMVDRTGKITHVVVGVGGFLGIGEKNVAIPFEKVNFAQQPLPRNTQAGGAAQPARTGMAPANTGMSASTNTSTAPSTNTDMTSSTNAGGLGAPVSGAAPGVAGGVAGNNGNAASIETMPPAMPSSMAYPDHGTIDYTADQLKSAPTFNYAK